MVRISEETCFYYARLACEKYLKVHPEDLASVSTLLSKIQMSSNQILCINR
ncbi:ribonuclease toxin immunity protein CdiI [Providencia hangzhouensis]|uniref:ribonuclease toxin immunity protein CdiI n=1 Tax=Providencia hangzhouensis TaxID=3031799 RepID=UPI003F68C84D